MCDQVCTAEYNSFIYLRGSDEQYMLYNYMEDSKITVFWNKKSVSIWKEGGLLEVIYVVESDLSLVKQLHITVQYMT